MAQTAIFSDGQPSDGHLHGDLAVRRVALDLEVGEGALQRVGHLLGVGVTVRGRGRGKVRVRVRAEVRARVGVGVRVRVGHLRRDGQRGEGPRLARELLAQRVDVVEVDVRIADAMHEVAALEAARVREQAGEQRVARDVEGDTYALRVGVGVG